MPHGFLPILQRLGHTLHSSNSSQNDNKCLWVLKILLSIFLLLLKSALVGLLCFVSCVGEIKKTLSVRSVIYKRLQNCNSCNHCNHTFSVLCIRGKPLSIGWLSNFNAWRVISFVWKHFSGCFLRICATNCRGDDWKRSLRDFLLNEKSEYLAWFSAVW